MAHVQLYGVRSPSPESSKPHSEHLTRHSDSAGLRWRTSSLLRARARRGILELLMSNALRETDAARSRCREQGTYCAELTTTPKLLCTSYRIDTSAPDKQRRERRMTASCPVCFARNYDSLIASHTVQFAVDFRCLDYNRHPGPHLTTYLHRTHHARQPLDNVALLVSFYEPFFEACSELVNLRTRIA